MATQRAKAHHRYVVKCKKKKQPRGTAEKD